MDVKKFSVLEKVAISIALLLFASITFLIIFQRDWLDDLIYGSLPEESKIDYNLETVVNNMNNDIGSVGLEFVPLDEGSASLKMNLSVEKSITGFEISLQKDVSLEDLKFECQAPFECLFFESVEDEIFFAAIVPFDAVSAKPAEDLVVGILEYSGAGNIRLIENSSLVSSLEDPEINLLDFSVTEFSLF